MIIGRALNYENQNFDFHSRFSAKQKTYIYKVLNRKQPLGLHSDYFWHVSYELPLISDLEEISSVLIGEHDFSAFRSKFCQSPKPIRTIDEINVRIIKKNLMPFENEIHFEIKAKSFLHNQVRLIVGTLMFFARSKISKEEAKFLLNQILVSKNRNLAKEKAPAHGLYLLDIKY
jgi:tRNA pseudouridine38-40 synthase